MKYVFNVLKVVMAFVFIFVFGSAAAILRLISFGALTNFNRVYFIPLFCRISLFCLGIKLDNRIRLQLPDRPHFITFNHNSYLDGFVLMGLGLPNTRILMSEKILIFLPVWLISFSIGLLYIPMKTNRTRRLRFFLKLEKRIKEENIHIMGSSEGVHVYGQRIAEFNRGVYHMALVSNMPVVALFIYTPIESNPYSNFRPFKRGTVIAEVLDIIPTDQWTMHHLDVHIADVRKKYVDRFNEYYQDQTT